MIGAFYLFGAVFKMQKQKQTKETTRTGTEPQKWRSHGGLSTGEWEGEGRGKGTENP